MAVLDTLRGLVPAGAREQVYTVVSAGVALFAGLGFITQGAAGLWVPAALAAVTLLFAVLHSTSTIRTAVYALLAAAAPLAVWYSVGTSTQWAAVLAFAGAALGLTKAAGRTPAVVDGDVVAGGRHRAEGT